LVEPSPSEAVNVERDWENDIIGFIGKREVGGGKLSQQFSDTQVAMIFELLNGFAERLLRCFSIMIIRPGTGLAERWRSGKTPSALMVRTCVCRERNSTPEAQWGCDRLNEW
jgi:hypothetical protein